ncbi:hypothetical protein B0H17DRAFT_1203377 [Mycena rosella]|uniref:Uncharacterized protein n=1 Tax=Mycena rosella TaxID=1033263 RepID=A0AAD7DC50_MYCRO|nr:hypothetical protein B0H17DRAFT_1203377 [Mycena rosella]
MRGVLELTDGRPLVALSIRTVLTLVLDLNDSTACGIDSIAFGQIRAKLLKAQAGDKLSL